MSPATLRSKQRSDTYTPIIGARSKQLRSLREILGATCPARPKSRWNTSPRESQCSEDLCAVGLKTQSNATRSIGGTQIAAQASSETPPKSCLPAVEV